MITRLFPQAVSNNMDCIFFFKHIVITLLLCQYACAGGHAVCGGTGTGHDVVCFCAGGCGVDAGKEPDHTRSYGPAVLSAAAGREPLQISVL